MKKLINSIKIGYWAYSNPDVVSAGNFKMLGTLLELILKVANEHRPISTHLAFIFPDKTEQAIVSLWAGPTLGADPILRIKELVEENNRLKMEVAKHVNN